jgi:hypothetical protein
MAISSCPLRPSPEDDCFIFRLDSYDISSPEARYRFHQWQPKSLRQIDVDQNRSSLRRLFLSQSFLSTEVDYGALSSVMFANLLFRLRNLTPSVANDPFVQAVRVSQPIPRNRRSEVLLVAGWGLIGLKCWATFWLVERYTMPFDPWWIVAPTIAAAAICTWIYWRRN